MGNAEAIEIIFNPQETSFRNILKFFFIMYDSTTQDRQGNDIGDSYRSAVFFTNNNQEIAANNLITEINESGVLPGIIKTEVVKAGKFYEAEKEYQDYLERNPGGYTCHLVRHN